MRNDGLFAAVFLLSRSRPAESRSSQLLLQEPPIRWGLETLGPLALYLGTSKSDNLGSDPFHPTRGTPQGRESWHQIRFWPKFASAVHIDVCNEFLGIYTVLKNGLSLIHTAWGSTKLPLHTLHTSYHTLLQLHLSLRHILFGFTCRLVSNASHAPGHPSQPYSWPASTPPPRLAQIRPPGPEPP